MTRPSQALIGRQAVREGTDGPADIELSGGESPRRVEVDEILQILEATRSAQLSVHRWHSTPRARDGITANRYEPDEQAHEDHGDPRLVRGACQAAALSSDTSREPQMPAKKARLRPKVKKRALTLLAPRWMNEWAQRVKKKSQARTTDSRSTEPLT